MRKPKIGETDACSEPEGGGDCHSTLSSCIVIRNIWVDRTCMLIGVLSVVDATIHFRDLFNGKQKQYDAVGKLLRKVSQCNAFRPYQWIILVLTKWNFTNVPCPSFGWKNLILKLGLIKWHHPGLCLVLRNSRSLET